VTDIRGYGLLAAFDLAPGSAPGVRGYDVLLGLYAAGLLVKVTGDAVLLSPPLIAERSHVDEMMDKLRGVLASVR
jgi:beta-alanine--pyruvate transaminase